MKKDILSTISNIDKLLCNFDTNEIMLSDFVMVSLFSSTLDKQVRAQVQKMSNIVHRMKFL